MVERRSAYVRLLLVGMVPLLIWFVSAHWTGPETPYQLSMAAAHRAFADKDYRLALSEFAAAAAARPADSGAYFGQALSLMQLDRENESLVAFGLALHTVSSTREKAFILANRGILHDRMQRFQAAIIDYEQALNLDQSVAAGPGFVSRFVHNQADPPPTIATRVQYLRQELAKPEEERLLAVPELDDKTFPYKP